MLQLAIALLLLSLIAGIFGFGGIAANFAGVAQILFFVFIVLFLDQRGGRSFARPTPGLVRSDSFRALNEICRRTFGGSGE